MLFIAPDKHSIYSKNFPNWAIKSNKITDVTIQSLKNLQHLGISTLFPYEDLISNSKDQLYFKTDTHWNKKGAEIAFFSIAKALNLELSNQSALVVPVGKTKVLGDLKAIVGLPDNFKFEDVKYIYKFGDDSTVFWSENGKTDKKIKTSDARSRGYEPKFFARSFNPKAKIKKKVFLICDSFGTLLSPFLTYYFEEVYMTSNIKTSEILTEELMHAKPDIIIYEIIERSFIVN